MRELLELVTPHRKPVNRTVYMPVCTKKIRQYVVMCAGKKLKTTFRKLLSYFFSQQRTRKGDGTGPQDPHVQTGHCMFTTGMYEQVDV